MDLPGISSDILSRFAAIVGPANVLRSAEDIAPRLVENRGLYRGASPMILKPDTYKLFRPDLENPTREDFEEAA